MSPHVEARPPTVTISGGADDTSFHYAWTVKNEYTSPIVCVEFPHYRATIFHVPDGWSGECTFQLGTGAEDRPGVCSARASSPESATQPGAFEEFHLAVWREGTRRGRGSVLVRFADNTEYVVPGVELPLREAVGDRYIALIGLTGIFAIWLAVRAARRAVTRRKRASESVPGSVEIQDT